MTHSPVALLILFRLLEPLLPLPFWSRGQSSLGSKGDASSPTPQSLFCPPCPNWLSVHSSLALRFMGFSHVLPNSGLFASPSLFCVPVRCLCVYFFNSILSPVRTGTISCPSLSFQHLVLSLICDMQSINVDGMN